MGLCTSLPEMSSALAVLGLHTARPPFKVPAMREMMQFHAKRQSDEGLTWLKEQVRSAITEPRG